MRNGNFLGQAYTILAGLNEVVEAMGSKANSAKEINHLGWTHFNRGVTTAMFEVFNLNQLPFNRFIRPINRLKMAAIQPHHH